MKTIEKTTVKARALRSGESDRAARGFGRRLIGSAKTAGKWLLRIGAGLALAAAVILGFFAVKGAVLYDEAMEENPIETTVGLIRQREDFVSIDELPDYYINAVKAVEDRKFDTHCGINVMSICRALWHDIRTLSFEQGGSTITQQLAKNLFFTQEKKPERKFAEIYAAFALEKKYGKDEIFELYVNTIYFGSGYYGIAAAAEGYFGKTPAELSEYECAMLAGLPNAPSAYSPDTSPELAEQRTKQVLKAVEEWSESNV